MDKDLGARPHVRSLMPWETEEGGSKGDRVMSLIEMELTTETQAEVTSRIARARGSQQSEGVIGFTIV